MKRKTSLFLALILVLAAAALAYAQKPLTNDDILKMVRAGFDEATIIKAIEANEPDFDTSVQALLDLKNAGVSEKIISAMLERKRKKNVPDSAPGVDKRSNPESSEPELKRREESREKSGPTPPAIYVEEVSSEGGVLASSDTALECMKTLQDKGMRVVTVKEKADYVLQVTRQLGKKSWKKDTKIVLSNREGEVVLAKSTRSVGGAMGDVADYIKKHHELP